VSDTVAALPVTFFQGPKYQSLMTSDKDEIYQLENLHADQWKVKPMQNGNPPHWFPQQVVGTIPLYRYYLPKTGDHLFTLDPDEGSEAEKYLGYQSEGISGYVFKTNDDVNIALTAHFCDIERFKAGDYHWYWCLHQTGDGMPEGRVFEGQIGYLLQPMDGSAPPAFASL